MRRPDLRPPSQERDLPDGHWIRSGLPVPDFAPLVGLSRHTLYAWKQRFDQLGPYDELLENVNHRDTEKSRRERTTAHLTRDSKAYQGEVNRLRRENERLSREC